MKISQSILIFLIPLIAWTQKGLPEEFELDGGITGIHLRLLEDSTFILKTGDCGGIANFKGSFKYNQDTLILTKTHWEWDVKPAEMRTVDGEIEEQKPVFDFEYFLRQGDNLYLIIDIELIEPNHLEKTKKKN